MWNSISLLELDFKQIEFQNKGIFLYSFMGHFVGTFGQKEYISILADFVCNKVLYLVLHLW